MPQNEVDAAIAKLCTIPDANTRQAINTELVSYSNAEVRTFLEDVLVANSNKYLGYNASKIDVGIVRAWKRLVNNAKNVNIRTAFAQDFILLTRVKEISENQSYEAIFQSSTIANFDKFLEIYLQETPCNTCPKPGAGSNASRMPKLDEILTNMISVHNIHKNKPDFLSSFFKGNVLSAGNFDYRDGGQHMLKYMADNSFTDNAIWIDRKFSYVSPQIINSGKEFDIYMGNTSPNGIWFIECKSYSEGTNIDVEQLIAYLSAINSLENLRYVFNAKKLTTEQAKQKMQEVFRKNATVIFNALNPSGKFQQLFGGITLNGQPVIINDDNDLRVFCAETNSICIQSTLFRFVITN